MQARAEVIQANTVLRQSLDSAQADSGGFQVVEARLQKEIEQLIKVGGEVFRVLGLPSLGFRV